MVDPDHFVRVHAHPCSTCIFGPNSPVTRERAEEMRTKAEAGQGMIPCHHTLDQPMQNICRTYFNRTTVGLIQVADRLGYVRFYEPEEWT